jgi:hypothetical protein
MTIVPGQEGVLLGIDTLQVASLCRLADKTIISPGQSIVEFSLQGVYSTRAALKKYASRAARRS